MLLLPKRHMKIAHEDGVIAPKTPNAYSVIKMTVEWGLSLILLVLAAPILAIVAVLVKISSPGPVFYNQLRLGQDGREYRVYKIRTMLNECEVAGAVWAVQDDPRVTPIGRFLRETHLDEIPQLWNVLRGEMSLIGPRPERPEIATQLESVMPTYRERLLVRPGITGLAQLRLPADSDVSGVRRKLSHDLYYIRERGFILDLQIVLSTLPYLLARFSKSLSELLIRSHGKRADRQRNLGGQTEVVETLELRLPVIEASRAMNEAMDGAQAA